jgi:hypothetical protein
MYHTIHDILLLAGKRQLKKLLSTGYVNSADKRGSRHA